MLLMWKYANKRRRILGCFDPGQLVGLHLLKLLGSGRRSKADDCSALLCQFPVEIGQRSNVTDMMVGCDE